MRNLKEVFCHLHSHSQPRYPYFVLCPYCREEAPYEAIVVEATVNYFSLKLPDFSVETELEIQMGTAKRRADVILVDGKQNYTAIIECKRIGVQEDGIAQLQSYLCATDTPFGVFANSTEPGDWEFYENLGRNKFSDITSDLFFKDIRDALEEERTEPSTNAETYYYQGLIEYKLERYDAAIANYGTAIQLKPDLADAYVARGLVKYKLGKHDVAIADYDTAIQLKPDLADAYIGRGLVKYKLGEYDAAIADYDTAIQLKPDDTAYSYRGDAKASLGQHNAAIADYDTAIQLKPDDANSYIGRGEAKIAIGEYDAAIADYDTAIQLKPDSVKSYTRRGLVYGRMGEYDAAIADYDTAIQLKPDHAIAYARRGLAKAKQDLQTALRLAEKSRYSNLKAKIERILRLLE